MQKTFQDPEFEEPVKQVIKFLKDHPTVMVIITAESVEISETMKLQTNK